MDIGISFLDNSPPDSGIVVVIDVWRSFTTAAYAFAGGVQDIYAVGSVEEALALRRRLPDTLLMGMGVSLAGPPLKDFNFGNSPEEVSKHDLHGQRIIQCTPNGTRGLLSNRNADILLASSFVCAGATIRYLKRHSQTKVTFVCTESGIEDQACAKYMAAILRKKSPNAKKVLNEIRGLGLKKTDQLFTDGIITETQRALLLDDLDHCLSLDQFDFTMLVRRQDDLCIMNAVI